MTTVHTPTPWALEGSKVVCHVVPKRVFGDNGEYEAPFIVVQPTLYTSADRAEQLANAEFIVTACNEYQPNLDALAKAGQRVRELEEKHAGLLKMMEAIEGSAMSIVVERHWIVKAARNAINEFGAA